MPGTTRLVTDKLSSNQVNKETPNKSALPPSVMNTSIGFLQRLEYALFSDLSNDLPEGECPSDAWGGLSSTLHNMNSAGLIERPVNWVALAGFMGTGKSRIGWELSRELALHFVDTDKLFTRVMGKSIPEVFAKEGEEYFRACEQEIVRRVTRLEHAVISLGGGTFIQEANRQALLARGPVVVLHATPETVYARTKNSDRPLLHVDDPLSRISELMNERQSAYSLGNIHVHSDGRPSEEIVEEIIDRLYIWEDTQREALHAPPTSSNLIALDLERARD